MTLPPEIRLIIYTFAAGPEPMLFKSNWRLPEDSLNTSPIQDYLPAACPRYSLAFVNKKISNEFLCHIYETKRFIFIGQNCFIRSFQDWDVSPGVLQQIRHCQFVWGKYRKQVAKDEIEICVTSILREVPNVRTLVVGTMTPVVWLKWLRNIVETLYGGWDIQILGRLEGNLTLVDFKNGSYSVKIIPDDMDWTICIERDDADSEFFATHHHIDVEEWRGRMGEFALYRVPIWHERDLENPPPHVPDHERFLCWKRP